MKAYNYDDIYLIPNKCVLTSRSNADTSVILGKTQFKLPIVPANMSSTINSSWAQFLDMNGYFYIMHRFNNSTVPFVEYATKNNFNTISISTGVGEESLLELESIKGYKIDYITIDIAHGHSESVAKQIAYIKTHFKNTYVIAGNIASNAAARFLQDAGADAIKVGIGSGVICTTKLQTGFHIPMFTCITECVDGVTCDVIADGGIKYPGDVSKALVAGATMVMAGGMFAGCSDSPAGMSTLSQKSYHGSTSLAAKGTNNHIEGRTVHLPLDVPLKEKLRDLTQALQSSISYAGGTDLKAFNGVKWKC